MCNPAKLLLAWVFLRKKGGLIVLLSVKRSLWRRLYWQCVSFFCNPNRRLPRGDGGSLARSSFLRFVGSAKALMIASKNYISGLRRV